jgi:hypothetical protein
MIENHHCWSIRAYSEPILDIFGIDAEMFALNEVINDVRCQHPNHGEIKWRIVDADEASWLVGAEAFEHEKRVFYYAWQGDDVIAQARGYAQ